MNVSAAKENILKKIRKALSESTPIPFPASEGNSPLFPPAEQDLEVHFAEAFTRLAGKFQYCMDEDELAAHLWNLCQQQKWTKIYCSEKPIQKVLQAAALPLMPELSLEHCEVSITSCEFLVARTGTVVLSAAQQNGRTASVFAPVHICIAYASQLVYDIKDSLKDIKDKYQHKLPSLITFATGASRTADIEKTLVTGVHGPSEVYVFLVDHPQV